MVAEREMDMTWTRPAIKGQDGGNVRVSSKK